MPGEQADAFVPLTDIFISYAHADSDFVQRLETDLRQQGFAAWVDYGGLSGGQQWRRELQGAIDRTQVLLVVLSPDAVASLYVQIEYSYATDEGKLVIPLYYRVCKVPMELRNTQWIDFQHSYEQGLAALVHALHRQVGTTPTHAPSLPKQLVQPFTASRDRNRQRMLERVRITWITGVLEHSLHDAALIALGLREEPEVLANPWRLVVQEIDHPAQPLPAGTRITQVYDEAGGALLILGEPGAGKTTLLLELARELLTHAQADEREPIPVVFNLSSWAQKRAPLADWLVEELYLRYQVPRTLGQTWVDNDQLLLLLDGLDEVSAAQRGACIKAINSYRQVHPLVPVVVCSRRADYLNQAQQLGLQRAVVVQPLTAEQIDAYLASAEEQVAAVRVALRDDPVLQGLATTPLLLNILILAYWGVPLAEITEGGSAEARQKQLFASYVQHMLKRRRAETRYTPEQTTHWLVWLARQMKQQSQTVFYIEQMQPDWLPEGRLRQLYQGIVGGLLGLLTGGPLGLLMGGLVALLINGVFVEISGGQFYVEVARFVGRTLSTVVNGVMIGLIVGLVSGLSLGLVNGLLNRRSTEIKLTERFAWSSAKVGQDILEALVIAFVGGLVDILTVELANFGWVNIPGLLFELIAALVFVLSGGLVGGLLKRFSRKKLNQPNRIAPRQEVWRSVRGGILVGLLIVVTIWLVSRLAGAPIRRLVFVLVGSVLNEQLSGQVVEPLIFFLIAGLLSGLVFGLLNGFSHEKLDEHDRMVPNQGIWHSARNGLFVGLLTAILIGLVCVLVGVLIDEFPSGLGIGLVGGLSIGLISGLLNGGITCIKHAVLRVLLWCAGSVFWNYPRFLDYATERILLRKVGGGYIFTHRLLLDYFASLETIPASEEPPAYVPSG